MKIYQLMQYKVLIINEFDVFYCTNNFANYSQKKKL